MRQSDKEILVNKAKLLNVQHRRKFDISYSIPDAWEAWIIEVHEDTPAEITPEWLEANPEKWDWYDCLDRGGDNMADLTVDGER
jgi:hypothetical protein